MKFEVTEMILGLFEIVCSISELTNSKTEPMVKFLPLILDKLIGLIVAAPLLNGQPINCANVAFDALASIIGTLTVINYDVHLILLGWKLSHVVFRTVS